MTDILNDLQRAILRAEECAGTMPAKEAVKLRPVDWHDVTRLGRLVCLELLSARKDVESLTNNLAAAQRVDEQQTAEFMKDKAEIARLRKALEAARDDFELIEQRINDGQVRRAGETAHQGSREARQALEARN